MIRTLFAPLTRDIDYILSTSMYTFVFRSFMLNFEKIRKYLIEYLLHSLNHSRTTEKSVSVFHERLKACDNRCFLHLETAHL